MPERDPAQSTVKSADPPETKQMIGTDMILPAASGALFIALCAVLPCRHEGRPLAARRGDRQKPPSDVAWGAPPEEVVERALETIAGERPAERKRSPTEAVAHFANRARAPHSAG